MSTYFIVWNETKTEGFVTTDPGLAYEVRKSAESNCYYENGDGAALTAKAFCEQWGEDNCVIETFERLPLADERVMPDRGVIQYDMKPRSEL